MAAERSRDLIALVGAADALVPTQAIDIGNGANPALRLGWSFNETWGDGTTFAWAMHPAAEVSFTANGLDDLSVTMKLMQFQKTAMLAIEVNGKPLPALALEGRWGSYSFEIDHGLLQPGENVLRFDFGAMKKLPARSGRPVAAAFASIRLSDSARTGSTTQKQQNVANGGASPGPLALLRGTGLVWKLRTEAGSALHLGVDCPDTPFAGKATLTVQFAEKGKRYVEILRRDACSRTNRPDIRIDLPTAEHGELLILNEGPDSLSLRTARVTDRFPRNASDGPPSILLIVLDAFRADHLHSLGYPRATSPCIDRLAREGALFTHTFSQGPMTIVSMASLLTGTYAPEHQTRAETKLSGELPTLAEGLAAQGYRTAAVSANPFVSETFGLARGFETFVELFEDIPFAARGVDGVVPAEAVTEATLDLLSSAETTPFFLLAHYLQPHAPYAAPRARWGKCDAPADGFDGREALLGEAIVKGRTAAEAIRDAAIDCYDDNILYVDAEICRLRDGLELLDLLQDTVIVVTSDHGEQFLDHGGFGHPPTHLYDESIHVPLVMRFPGKAPRRIETAVQLVDLTATLLAIGEAPPLRGPGRSLVPLLDGHPADEVPALAFGPAGKKSTAGWARAIRTRKHKLIAPAPSTSPLLFDLETDPGEHRNQQASQPGTTQRLRAELDLRTTRSTASATGADIPGHLRRQLEALGYLE